QIDDVARLAFQLIVAMDASRPVRDQRRRNAAFVNEMLVFAERRVADVAPAFAIGDESVAGPGENAGALKHRVTIARLLGDHVRLNRLSGHRRKGWMIRPSRGPLAADGLQISAVVLEEEDQRVIE